MRLVLFTALLCAITSVHLVHGQITASLNEDFRFVLNGNGQLSGVDINSPAGALVPNDNAQPFTFMLSNTVNQITYGNLGTLTTIDGAVTLGAGYDPTIGEIETTIFVGIGAEPVQIPFVAGACEACPLPPLGVSINADRNFVLRGYGNEVSSLTFRSPSGSLSPSESPAPFEAVVANSANELQLASPGDAVTIDGQVVLGAGWSDHLYSRDVEYEYQQIDKDGQPVQVGPFAIRSQNYDYRLPNFPLLGVRVRDDDHIVLTGSGQPIESFRITSTTDSLLPADSPGPFDAYISNTPGLVEFQLDEPMVLDGEIVLPTKWNWEAPKKVFVNYDQVGELPERTIGLPQARFPEVPFAGREPLLITLDDNNNFVITGIGQEVLGIEFISAAGGLRTSDQDSIAPFPLMLSNEPDNIALGVLGKVAVDGSFVMDFGPADPLALDEIEINVGFGPFATPNPANVECDRCEYPAVVVNEDRGLVLENFPQPVSELRFSSKFGGFEIRESAPEGLSLVSSTANELVVASEDGLSGHDLSGLQAIWGSSFDGQVFVSVAFVDGTSFGPLALELSSPSVPEPATWSLGVLGCLGLLKTRRRRAA